METYSDGERVQQNTYIRGETRIRKEEGSSLQNLTDITNYFYQEGSVLYTTGQDNENKSFNLLNVSDIFATERESENTEEYYFYLNDTRGSKTGLIDNTAEGVVSYWYNDFGEVSEERNEDYEDFINEVQYTGAIYDSSTGLLYLNARFYDPETGIFTSQDTYRGERDEPVTWHLYAYCANDPVNFVDPSGNKYTVLGAALQLGLSSGKLFKTFCFGLDFVWFNKNVKTRYGNRSFHIYLAAGAGYSNNTQSTLVNVLKNSPKNLLNSFGLKKIVKKMSSGYSLYTQAALIMGDTKQFASYSNYAGSSINLSLGIKHLYISISHGIYNVSVGFGCSSSSSLSISYGYSYSYFLQWTTGYLAGNFESIRKTVTNRANKAGRKTHHR